jgi:hypothetical protein
MNGIFSHRLFARLSSGSSRPVVAHFPAPKPSLPGLKTNVLARYRIESYHEKACAEGRARRILAGSRITITVSNRVHRKMEKISSGRVAENLKTLRFEMQPDTTTTSSSGNWQIGV